MRMLLPHTDPEGPASDGVGLWGAVGGATLRYTLSRGCTRLASVLGARSGQGRQLKSASTGFIRGSGLLPIILLGSES